MQDNQTWLGTALGSGCLLADSFFGLQSVNAVELPVLVCPLNTIEEGHCNTVRKVSKCLKSGDDEFILKINLTCSN